MKKYDDEKISRIVRLRIKKECKLREIKHLEERMFSEYWAGVEYEDISADSKAALFAAQYDLVLIEDELSEALSDRRHNNKNAEQ